MPDEAQERWSLRAEVSASLRLMLPLASAQVAQAATGFVDTVMMGWLGQSTLAAGGLAATTFTLILVVATGVLMGVSPLVAAAFGGKQPARIQQLTHQGLWLALGLALPLMGLLAYSDRIMRHFGQTASLAATAQIYLDILRWGLLPALLFALLKSVVSSLLQPRPILLIVVAGTLLNAIGNYLIGLGHGGFPKLGLAGIAWSSTISQWAMLLCLVVYVLRQRPFPGYGLLRQWQPVQWQLQGELLQMGVPIAIAFGLEIGLFTMTTYLMGALGAEMLAAHQIVFQTIAIIFMVPLGMSFATTIRVGQWHGQRHPQAIRRTSYVNMGMGGLYMLLMATLLLLFPRSVIGLYLDVNLPENQPVIALATSMLTIAALSQVLDGVQTNASGALRGLQDTKIPVMLSFIAFWGVGLTSGYVMGFGLGWQGVGLWLGQLLGVAMAAVVFIWRFQRVMRAYPET